jgi:hypothetical protein
LVNNRWLGLFIGILFAGALACNAQSSTPTPTRPETLTPTDTSTPLPLDPSRTLAPPETLAAGLTITAAPEDSATTRPTFTPIQPTLAATVTPSGTPLLLPTLRPTRSPVPAQTVISTVSGPLSFSYEISWRLSPDDPMEAIATVKIFASGGGGGYTYFRDGFEVEGSTFEYLWRVCKGNPGTLTVNSADGQSLSQTYFEDPPCPTPTPSPTP